MQKKNKKTIAILATALALGGSAAAATLYTIIVSKTKQKEYDSRLKKLEDDKRDVLYDDDDLTREIEKFLDNPLRRRYQPDNLKDLEDLESQIQQHHQRDIQNLSAEVENSIISASVKSSLASRVKNLENKAQKSAFKRELDNIKKFDKEVSSELSHITKPSDKARFEKRFQSESRNSTDLDRLKGDILIYIANEADSARRRQEAIDKLNAQLIQRVNNNSNYNQDSKKYWIDSIKDLTTKKDLEKLQLLKNKLDTNDNTFRLNDGQVKNELLQKTKDATKQAELDSINAQSDKILNDKRDNILSAINKLLIEDTKSKFNADLEQSNNEKDLDNLASDVKKAQIIEESSQNYNSIKNANYLELNNLITHVEDINRLQELNNDIGRSEYLGKSRSKHKDIVDVHDKIIGELNKQSPKDTIAYEKAALKDKINNFSVPLSNKDELLALVDTMTAQNSSEVINKINEALVFEVLKHEAPKAVENLDVSHELHDKLKSRLAQPNLNIFDYDEIIKEAIKPLNALRSEIRKGLEILDDFEQKNTLSTKLKTATKESELIEIKNKVDSLNQIRENIRDKARKLVERLSESDQKEVFKKLIQIPAVRISELENIISTAQRILHNEQQKAKTNAQKANDHQRYSELNKQANTDTLTQDQYKAISDEANRLFETQKNSTSQLIADSKLDDTIKDQLVSQTELASNIKELKVIEAKLKALEKVSKITDPGIRGDLQNKILDIELDDADAHKKITEAISDADNQLAKENTNIVENAKRQIKSLPYPSGENSEAIKEMLTEIDKIQNDQSLSSHQKTQKITKLINQIGALNSKIQEAKKEIEKLSLKRQKELNDLLDKTNLLPEGSNEFDTLFQKIKDAKANDKKDFVNKINSLSHLTNQQHDEFINKINQLETDNYDKLNKIYSDAQLRDKLNDFIDTHVKKLEYPAQQNAQAIRDIIAEVEKIDSEEQLENFKRSDFENIKSNVKRINDTLQNLHAVPSDVTEEFNKANTNDEFDKLNTLINEKIANEKTKSVLDHKVETLPYPNADGSVAGRGQHNAKAITEIKRSYVDSNGVPNPQKMKDVEGKLQQITQNINKAIEDINKISQEARKLLWEKLRETHTDAGFDALTKQIEQAHLADINNALAEINKLSHLEEAARDKFKEEVGRADSWDKIDAIVDNARVDDYRQEIKNLIKLSEYVNGDVSEQSIKDKFNKTKQTISNQIDKNVTGVDTHLKELKKVKDFITELHKVRDEISGLKATDVVDLDNSRTELNKLIVEVTDTAGLDKVKLEIKKRKLIKKVADAGYEKDAEAIKSLNEKINNASSDAILDELDKFITELPQKIRDAKAKINEISNNAQVKDAEKRKKTLLEELKRADTEAKFEILKQHIESAKTQNEQEYKDSIKKNIIERAKTLGYPKSNSETDSTGSTLIVAEIEKDFQGKTNPQEIDTLAQKWNTNLSQIESKVRQAKDLISKTNQSKLDNHNTKLNQQTTTSNLDKFIEELNKEIKEDTDDVLNKINALKHLNDKDSFTNNLDNLNYQQKQDKLHKAYKADIEARIDKLKYYSTKAPAKTTLKQQLVNIVSEQQHKQKIDELDELDKSLESTKQKIQDLPYKTPNSKGRKHLQDLLDTKTDKTQVDNLVLANLKQDLDKYFTFISKEPNAIDAAQQNKLKSQYEEVTTQEQLNTLKHDIYSSKRDKAHSIIEALSNLDAKVKAEQKAKITDKEASSITDLGQEFTAIDKIILETQKLDAKSAVDKLPYPLDNSKSESARNTLKQSITSAVDLQAINKVLEKVKQLNTKIIDFNDKVKTIKLSQYKAKINEEIVKVYEPSGFAKAELEFERAKIADKIADIKGLKDTKRDELLKELDSKTTKDEFKPVYLKGLLEFNKQDYIEKTIKTLKYIKHPNSNVYKKSIEKLTKEIEKIDTTKDLNSKKAEIDKFIQKLEQKVAKFNEIFNKYSSYTHAKSKIADAIDSSTTVTELDNALPDNWLTQIDEASGVVNLYFGANTLSDELQKTYPSAVEGRPANGLTLKELHDKIVNEMHKNAFEKIDKLISNDQHKKDEIKDRIRSIRTNNISPNPITLTKALKDIFDITIQAQKDDLSAFIDKIGFPQSSNKTAVEQLKNTYVQGFKEELKFNQNDQISKSYRELKEIKEHVTAANTEIAKLASQSQKDQLNNRLALTYEIAKIDKIKEDAKTIKTLEEELNKITHLNTNPNTSTDSTSEDKNKVNLAIDTLKAKLKEKLDNLVSSSQSEVQTFRDYLEKTIATLNKLKTLFTTDTIVMKRYVDKITNTNNISELKPILDDAIKFDDLFKAWWTSDTKTYNGRYIKDNKTLLTENANAPISKKIVDGVNFKTYENLLKEIRESEDFKNVNKIVNYDYALYHGLIDYLKTTSSLKDLPTTTYAFYRDEVLKAQSKDRIETLKDEIDKTARVISKIKKDLLLLPSGNNAALLIDVDGIKNYSEALTIERKVNDFITEYNKAKAKLDQYKKSVFKNDAKAKAFDAELLRVDEKNEAITLANKIDAELVKVSKKDAINKLSSLNQEQKQHWYTLIDNENNISKLNDIVTQASQFNNKVNEAKNILSSVGVESNRTELSKLINNARNIQDIDNALNKIKAFKSAYTLAAKYVDEYAKFSIKDPTKNTEFTKRKGMVQSAEQASTLLNDVKSKFVEQIKDVVKQIKYPDNNSQDATNSRNTLNGQVDHISSPEGYIPLYEKIHTIQSLLNKRIEEINTNKLPYEANSEALATIKRELNKATTPERIRQVYPEDWAQTVQTYRDALDKYLPKNNLTQKLWDRFNKTWNANGVETPAGMQEQLYATLKRDVKNVLRTLNNLPQNNNFVARIDQVPNNSNIDANLDQIATIYFEAFQQNYTSFIEKIAYPNGKYQSQSTKTKEALKAKVNGYASHKSLVYEDTNKSNLESELNQINTKVGEIKNRITALNLTKKTDGWTTELSKADSIAKLDALAAKLVPYEKVKLLINNIVDLANGFIGENNSDQDVKEVNDAYKKLRETFKNKLDQATDSNVQALGALADEVRKSIDQFRPAFTGDVLAQKHFVEQLNGANDAHQATVIKDNAINYASKLNEFWNGRDHSGSYIKDHKDKLVNAHQFDFKTYDELLREVRTFGDITRLSKFITEKVPLYHGFIDYRLATDNKLSGKAKTYYDNQIKSKHSKQELITLRDEAVKYINKHKEAKDKISQIGNEDHKRKFTDLLNNTQTKGEIEHLLNAIDGYKRDYKEFHDLITKDYSSSFNKLSQEDKNRLKLNGKQKDDRLITEFTYTEFSNALNSKEGLLRVPVLLLQAKIVKLFGSMPNDRKVYYANKLHDAGENQGKLNELYGEMLLKHKELYDQRIRGIIDKARTRLEARITNNKTAYNTTENWNKIPVRHNNYVDNLYLTKLENDLRNAQSDEEIGQLERKFLFERYAESRRLTSVLNSLEWFINKSRTLRGRNKETYINALQGLIDAFRDVHQLTGYVATYGNEKILEHNSTYIDTDEKSRTTSMFAHLWDKIVSRVNDQYDKQQLIYGFKGATQWESRFEKSNQRDGSWDWYAKNSKNSLIDTIMNDLKNNKNASVDEIYDVIDELSAIGLNIFTTDDIDYRFGNHVSLLSNYQNGTHMFGAFDNLYLNTSFRTRNYLISAFRKNTNLFGFEITSKLKFRIHRDVMTKYYN